MSLCFGSGSLNPFTDSNFVMNAQLDEYHFLTPIKIIMACSHGKKIPLYIYLSNPYS